MATAAVFIALGGGAYAASQINGKLIRKNSEPGNRIDKKTFVAKARFATSAASAATATHAASADSATSASHATAADRAGSAPPSGAAGGALAGSYPNPALANGAVTAADLAAGARTATLKTGETITGFVIVTGTAAGSGYGFESGAGFPILPQHSIPPENFHFVTGASAPGCPAAGQADTGQLCAYQTYQVNVSSAHVFAEDGHQLDATRFGLGIQATSAAAGDIQLGATWAYTQD